MHNHEVKIDLKVSRRESGLLQSDLSQLLGTTQARISRLERGKSHLNVEEMVKLAIIFNKSATNLFRLLTARLKSEVAAQIGCISPELIRLPNAEQRQKTLSRLADQLAAPNKEHHD